MAKKKRTRRKKYSKKQKKKIQGSLKHKRKSKKNPNYVYLTCSKCKRKRYIHVNDKAIYTDEIRENYICLFCKTPKRR